MHRYIFHLCLTVICLISTGVFTNVFAVEPQSLSSMISPYLDEETILVAHIDVSKIDVDSAAAMFSKYVQLPEKESAKIKMGASIAKAWLEQFKKDGGRHVFATFSMSDLRKSQPFLFVVFGEQQAVAGKPVGIVYPSLRAIIQPPFILKVSGNSTSPIFIGTQEILENADKKSNRSPKHLEEAFASVADSDAQIIFIPTQDHLRVLREMFPEMPKELNHVTGKTLADGLLWKAVGLKLPPKPESHVVIRSKDDTSAEQLNQAWQQVLTLVKNEPAIIKVLPDVAAIAERLHLKQAGNRLSLHIEEATWEPIIKKLLQPAVLAARQATFRTQRVNQFKQIGIAFWNYEDSHTRKDEKGRKIHYLPAHAIYSKAGKPLLSWRVAILPYLEQGKLYKQFHLDEPWDSDHNKKLISKMPWSYIDREAKIDPKSGRTTYVLPIGKELISGSKEGATARDITDGTSVTILTVEVVPERSVIWTKPEDWKVDKDHPLRGVKRSDRSGFTVGFCDGSVHFFSNDIDPKKFWKQLTKAGGEIVRR